MTYQIAERFKSIQGEGVYTGTPMAFIRFVGCSVGKRICQHCDTDFETVGSDFRGGGTFSAIDLLNWAQPYKHICLTGGEPLDQDLDALIQQWLEYPESHRPMLHIETSGTKLLNDWLHVARPGLWVCVSPKPGFIEGVVVNAQEIKVIVPGLGTTIPPLVNATSLQLAEDMKQPRRWPTLEDALRWAALGKTVYLQPRNGKFDVDKQNLLYVQDVIAQYPQLNLSVQMHKILRVQ